MDAVHGAPFLFSSKLKRKLDGIELADSVAWDAHKMMHVPSLCTFLLYQRRGDSFLAFENRASYLFDEGQNRDELLDLGKRTFECTKRAVAIPVMMLWALYGDGFFGAMSESLMTETQNFYDMLSGSKDFEAPFAPDSNILVFRYLPKALATNSTDEINYFQKNLRARLHANKRFFLTQANIDGKDYMRVTVINPRTTQKHFSELMSEIRQATDVK